ncbi:MAG: hypothetical protein KBD01_10620 [Acidobacteria bacterium]|nr:hypothetical protein [Acidobacteriota bacterium]
METAAPVRLAIGERLAGCWIVCRVFDADDACPAALARDESSSGRAFVFVLDAAGDPRLDDLTGCWGTSRRVLRDDRFGRVVIDEVPEGQLLSEMVAEEGAPTPRAVEDVVRKVRAAHKAGQAHGRLSPDLVVLGDDGPAIAGWGIAVGDPAELTARDQAFLAGLPAAGDTGATGEAGAPAAAGAPPQLRAAITSDHLPTLRRALEQWEAQGNAADDPDVLRARDALARLERKIGARLDEARRLIDGGDPLGAVAACREAIRAGAEQEAEALLKQARRQARRLVSRPSAPPWRRIAALAGAAAALALLVAALWIALRPSRSAGVLATRVAAIERAEGRRAAVRFLVGRVEQGDRGAEALQLLGTKLETLARAERDQLLALRERVAAQGARPREADALAEQALATLDDLARQSAGGPGAGTRFQRALLSIDRAASAYQAAARFEVPQAARAVEALIAQDPAFAPRRGGR